MQLLVGRQPELQAGGQVSVPDSAPETEQAHERLQSTPPVHEPLPLHLTVHEPEPQRTCAAHEDTPLQVTLQLPDVGQSIVAPQLLSPSQLIVQFFACVQSMRFEQLVGAPQPVVQTIPAGHVQPLVQSS